MKFLFQFLRIAAISFVSEILHYFIKLPVPASIYGLIIMFLLLETGILKLDDVKETGKFLIEIMPVMFVPACVGLIDVWGLVKDNLLAYIVII
ncbi:MAG: CidA/LrgA family protein, partial [Eubacteriales bacterium]|nr:CidA/LrgA family protein [Eubacteriales bacterium]